MEAAPSVRTRVFVVEDSASIRDRLCAQLREIDGVSVVGNADTPQSAVEAILRTRPDTVILDIHLIGGSGIEVLREVHPKAPKVMFIVLTNHPVAQYRRACLEAGASYFFDKTTELEKVKEVVAEFGVRPH